MEDIKSRYKSLLHKCMYIYKKIKYEKDRVHMQKLLPLFREYINITD